MTTNKEKGIELSELKASKQNGEKLVNRDMSLVKNVNVELEAVIGTSTISVETLFNLEVGEVVQLNEQVDTPVNLVLDGKIVARGNLVAVDDKFALKITDVS